MSLDAIAAGWADHMLGCLFDGTLVLLVVLAVWLPLRRRAPAQLGYGLFLLVLVKLALPLAVPAPGVVARFSASALAESAWARLSEAPASVPDGVYVVQGVPGGEGHRGVPVAGVLLLVWALVAGWLLVRFVRRELAARKRLRETAAECEGRLRVAFERLRELMGVRRRVRLLLADADVGPATAGFFRPFVVVPRGLVARLDDKQMSWVLLHELAHIRRGDVFVTLLQRLVQIAFFFHPAVWFANRVIDEQREFACDEAALVAGRGCGHELGETFLSVVEYSQAQTSAAALAMFDSKTVIRRRLMRMLEDRRGGGRVGRVLSAGLVGVVALLVIPDAALEAAPQDKKPSAKQQEVQQLQARLAELEKTRAALLERLRRLSEGVKREDRVKVDVNGTIDVNIHVGAGKAKVDRKAAGEERLKQHGASTLRKNDAQWRRLLESVKRATKRANVGYLLDVEPVIENGRLRLRTVLRKELRVDPETGGKTKARGKGVIERLLKDVKKATDDIKEGRGTLGTVIRDDSLLRRLNSRSVRVGNEILRYDVKTGKLLEKTRVGPKRRRLQ